MSGTKNSVLTGGDIAFYTPNSTAYDQSDGYSKQYSAELRFNTDFEGPVNFLLAGYYLKAEGYADYFVNADTLDYTGIVLGSIFGGEGAGRGRPAVACRALRARLHRGSQRLSQCGSGHRSGIEIDLR